MRRVILPALAGLTLTGLANAQTFDLKPGEWTYNTTINMTMEAQGRNMPMPAQNRTDTQCMSADEASFDPATVLDGSCEASNVRSSGGTMSFDITCEQNGMTMTGDMSMTKNGDGTEAAGDFNLVGEQPGVAKFDMTGSMTATRNGDC